MVKSQYDQRFFARNKAASYASAYHVLRALFDVYSPTTMLDVGCGIGTWGSVAKNLGITTYVGIDGHYIDRKQLEVEPSEFVPEDLTRPFDMERRFDLVISMEVAEHLSESAADLFISQLCHHSDLVLFSAAIPFQGGVHHVNEQWQSYWLSKFQKQGYSGFDVVRPRIWNNENVAEYYKQNTLVYIRSSSRALVSRAEQHIRTLPMIIDIVHPDSYLLKADPRRWSLSQIVKSLPPILRRVYSNRVLSHNSLGDDKGQRRV